jgi:hypothetical protein
MGSALRVALILVAGLGLCACHSAKKRAPGEVENPTAALAKQTKDVRVIWTRGGKLGYLYTYDVAQGEDTPVVMHEVEDLEFRKVGWVSNDGQGGRYDYPADKVREARREPFTVVELPIDTLENQVRRILGVDPETPIALRHAEEADLVKK